MSKNFEIEKSSSDSGNKKGGESPALFSVYDNGAYEQKIKSLERDIKNIIALEEENKRLHMQITSLNTEVQSLSHEVNLVYNSTSWKLTAPIRLISRLCNFFINCIKYLRSKHITTFLKTFHEKGLRTAISDLREYVYAKSMQKGDNPYELWMKNNDPNKHELREQRKAVFKIKPKISIVVPMYNTPIVFFKELVDCLIAQTYGNWELCLADGSESENKKIQIICNEDQRIKYKYLNGNKGIAGNSNAALKMSSGDYIALLDHDDILPTHALYEIVKCINEHSGVEFIYSDEDKIDENRQRSSPYFKPDFSPDTLRSNNYITHLSVLKKTLMNRLGGFREEYAGSQDHDLFLRMTEITDSAKIIHIPKILYHWRMHSQSVAQCSDAKPYAFTAGKLAVKHHLERLSLTASVSDGAFWGAYKIKYDVCGSPKVSILIPNKDGVDILRSCIDSIIRSTTYKNYEIVVIENNSTKQETFSFYNKLNQAPNIRVLYYKEHGFNYSKIINFGVRNVQSDFVVQLNNDIEIITPDWLEQMIGFAQRNDVGAVGIKLYYPDDTIQHAGVVIGLGGIAGHTFPGYQKDTVGYCGKASNILNLSAVTAACIMTRRGIYEEVGYMNESLGVAFNDIDFCLKIRETGKLIIYDPFVEMYHYESKTRGYENTPQKRERFQREISLFRELWKDFLSKGDPYYNINLRLDTHYYDIKPYKVTGP